MDEKGRKVRERKISKEVKKSGRSVRLVDVAELANVSRATAGRALGQYGLVDPETREKVHEAARQLNYRTNDVARSMRSGKTLTLGVVVAAISNSFFNGIILAIIQTASKFGYQVLILNTNDDVELEIDALRVLSEKRVDGLIVVPSYNADYRHLGARGSSAPSLILLDRSISDYPIAAVTTDDDFGAREAIRLLVNKGHRRIGLLIASQTIKGHSSSRPANVVSTVEERATGALAAISEAGLSIESSWVRYSQNAFHIALDAALTILGSRQRPTALLATNEEMALAAVAAASQLGMRIGTDLSLVSIDDTAWLRVFSPPISVIERPIYSLAETAVESLVAEIRSGVPAKSIKLTPRLIDRQSVRDLTP